MEGVNRNIKYTKSVRSWLILGLVMLIGQVVLGGITRLTGSGLSITSWDIITGVIPPLNQAQWIEAFNLYKATPQYEKINSTIDMDYFKFIYFWEYFHRLWVRSIGIIFAIPFLYFVIKKKIDWYLTKRLLVVVFLTALTASAGWIMVASGLVDRPWVNAYKLTVHWIMAMFVIWAMVRTIADVYGMKTAHFKINRNFVRFIVGLTLVQLVFAGLMAGMKAGLYYPSWPDMNGEFIPAVLMDSANWNWGNMINYDSYLFAPALVQFTHRLLAYLLLLFVVVLFFNYKSKVSLNSLKWLQSTFYLIIIQMVLGILTVLNVEGKIPLTLGVLHQLVGLLYFITLLFFMYDLRKRVP